MQQNFPIDLQYCNVSMNLSCNSLQFFCAIGRGGNVELFVIIIYAFRTLTTYIIKISYNRYNNDIHINIVIYI